MSVFPKPMLPWDKYVYRELPIGNELSNDLKNISFSSLVIATMKTI